MRRIFGGHEVPVGVVERAAGRQLDLVDVDVRLVVERDLDAVVADLFARRDVERPEREALDRAGRAIGSARGERVWKDG